MVKFTKTNFTNIILSIAGLEMTEEERTLFASIKPLGIILFARNIKDADQVKSLCDDIKETIAEDVLILIDQEGGRVMRVKFGINGKMKAPQKLLKIAANQPKFEAENLIKMQYTLSALELRELGINVNCAPVADLYFSFADKIIGDRSFGSNPQAVVEMCKVVDNALADSSVQSILKHIPGHGRALVDSHEKLPIVETELSELEATDFAVFKELSDIKIAMTAHVVYKALDDKNPATTSEKTIEYIRNQLNFKGILMTDDLSMKALSSKVDENFERSIDAGCDIGLYCAGKIDDMRKIANHASEIDKELLKKFHQLNCFNDINPKLNEYREKIAILFQEMVA